jgi:hypothetical protein
VAAMPHWIEYARVRLNRLEATVAKVLEVDGGAPDGAGQTTIRARAISSLRRVAEGAAVLLVLMIAAVLSSFWPGRK